VVCVTACLLQLYEGLIHAELFLLSCTHFLKWLLVWDASAWSLSLLGCAYPSFPQGWALETKGESIISCSD
jgi:hypothetical protein